MLGLPKGEMFLVPWTEEWEKEVLQYKKAAVQNDRLPYFNSLSMMGIDFRKN